LRVQAFRRLPRAGASPCTPCSIRHLLHGFRLPLKQSARKHPSQNLKTKPSGSLKTPSMRFQAALSSKKIKKHDRAFVSQIVFCIFRLP